MLLRADLTITQPVPLQHRRRSIHRYCFFYISSHFARLATSSTTDQISYAQTGKIPAPCVHAASVLSEFQDKRRELCAHGFSLIPNPNYMWLINALSRIFFGLVAVVAKALSVPLLLGSDILITLANAVLPRKSRGHVVDLWTHDDDGHKTLWPKYVPPEKTDSRSPCVALNCMANMGILPRDGRNIAFPDLERAVRRTFNTSPTFARLVTNAAAEMLHRNFRRDTLDLSDLCVHNGIEHDASVTRHDAALQPDQSKPASDLVDFILNSATGKDADGNANARLTLRDLITITTKRREDSRAANSQFTQTAFHILTGSTNRGALKDVFGGNVRDLKVILHEERLPEGWEPSNRSRFGMTIHNIVFTALAIELGVNEKKPPRRISLPTTSG